MLCATVILCRFLYGRLQFRVRGIVKSPQFYYFMSAIVRTNPCRSTAIVCSRAPLARRVLHWLCCERISLGPFRVCASDAAEQHCTSHRDAACRHYVSVPLCRPPDRPPGRSSAVSDGLPAVQNPSKSLTISAALHWDLLGTAQPLVEPRRRRVRSRVRARAAERAVHTRRGGAEQAPRGRRDGVLVPPGGEPVCWRRCQRG